MDLYLAHKVRAPSTIFNNLFFDKSSNMVMTICGDYTY